MKRKNVGLMLMVLSLLYFVSAVWGGFQMGGVWGAAINAVVLILFISGVWCLSATKRKGLGLVLMLFPFLFNVSGIWGGYQMAGVGGSVFNVITLIIFVTAVWCLSKPESDQN